MVGMADVLQTPMHPHDWLAKDAATTTGTLAICLNVHHMGGSHMGLTYEVECMYFYMYGTTFGINATGRQRTRARSSTTPLSTETSGTAALRSDRGALLVSSTSWTPDEDFSILLDAARAYDEQVTPFFFIIKCNWCFCLHASITCTLFACVCQYALAVVATHQCSIE